MILEGEKIFFLREWKFHVHREWIQTNLILLTCSWIFLPNLEKFRRNRHWFCYLFKKSVRGEYPVEPAAGGGARGASLWWKSSRWPSSASPLSKPVSARGACTPRVSARSWNFVQLSYPPSARRDVELHVRLVKFILFYFDSYFFLIIFGLTACRVPEGEDEHGAKVQVQMIVREV